MIMKTQKSIKVEFLRFRGVKMCQSLEGKEMSQRCELGAANALSEDPDSS